MHVSPGKGWVVGRGWGKELALVVSAKIGRTKKGRWPTDKGNTVSMIHLPSVRFWKSVLAIIALFFLSLSCHG